MNFTYEDHVIRVNMPDQPSLMEEVTRRFRAHQGFALATINLDHLVKLRQDGGFRQAYAAQDLVVADGNPIIWLSRLAGESLALVPGSDLVMPLARLAAAEDVPLALVGSTPEALEGAAAHIRKNVPGITIAACIAPPMGFDPESAAGAEVLHQLRDSGARLCFIALGAPKQERLAARGRIEAPEIGFASIGAGLDFLAGNQQRAPRWVRRIAMEWVWRMLSSPRRLAPRYARCAAILPAEAMNALKQRRAR
ncbi:WecB/TagA/CpsF family glycosyltransferase [Paracoccus seriniphilus]|uniref:Polymer biosynthesis protein, WecB/TagA/CpsF family n=1 Tax=Paracoccus seriniphilus TaxID=184748 RepID=A0A239PMI1_9RHOB|nr:WecB/TagA/CpsF family glycosyltransferase [Paracoccus seriniphilus]WCR15026.1 WecB/TagA/CpsF family glycosyltransferase [Paracoccus seriniphilus]SNT71535.1 polymer biosynthesis protein, WecB/TagA/CpsF family [Paracoccus seriniphilus]